MKPITFSKWHLNTLSGLVTPSSSLVHSLLPFTFYGFVMHAPPLRLQLPTREDEKELGQSWLEAPNHQAHSLARCKLWSHYQMIWEWTPLRKCSPVDFSAIQRICHRCIICQAAREHLRHATLVASSSTRKQPLNKWGHHVASLSFLKKSHMTNLTYFILTHMTKTYHKQKH